MREIPFLSNKTALEVCRRLVKKGNLYTCAGVGGK